jgi:putative transposase
MPAIVIAAFDRDGHAILVQGRRNAKAAKRFFRKLLKGLHYVPRVIVTDKPRTHSRIHNHFQLRRHRLTATGHRAARDAAFRAWR